MRVSPFLLLKRSTADLLAARTTAVLDRWAAAWATPPDATIACSAPSDLPGILAEISDWSPHILANGGSVWGHAQAGLVRHIEQILFDLSNMDGTSDKHLSSAIATSVAEEALADLSQSLIAELTGQASQPARPSVMPDRLIRPGSGAALCTVSFSGKALRFLLPAESMPSAEKSIRQASRPPIASLQRALETTQVTLSVEVSRTELTLGYLRTLAVGDVLALPTSVDHPLRVTGSDDTTVCHAHLGSLMGFHAIELIKPAD